ncbi:MAG: CBS domain-containing protein [Xanthomonadales bacterium]|nr:CBS domain-containing protein [Xanthomonadales bacterium]
MTVQRILNTREPAEPANVTPDTPVGEVLELLESQGVSAVIVSSDGQTVEGIVSERDIVRALKSNGSEVLEKRARELMTREVFTCVAEDRVAGIMAVMIDRHVRHVPVVKDGRFVSMVSIRDMLQLRLDEVQSEADAMRSYINGGGPEVRL